MARYYYDKYNVNYTPGGESIYPNRTGTSGHLRNPLTYSVTYWSSYSWNGTRFVGAGSAHTQSAGSTPLPGFYYISGSTVNLISSSTTIGGPDYSYHRYTLIMYTSPKSTRGSFIETIIAEEGSYPDNGISGGNWYVKGEKAFPELKTKINNQIRGIDEGWVKVNGVLRPIEQLWVKANGKLEEL